MKFGVATFLTEYTMPPQEIAREVEQRGFESIWLSEHSHIPVNRVSRTPGGDLDLPREYIHAHDPYVCAAAASVVTTRLVIGIGVSVIVERDPIMTAKQVASIDLISGGRFQLGIGGGWNAEEMANHGTEYKTRWRLLRERVQAMKEIWTQDQPEYHGEFVNFDKIWCYPKPLQKPYPPIIMGGDGPTTLDRVVDYCDGWMPHVRPYTTGANFPERLAALSRKSEEAGRNPASISVSAYGLRPEPDMVAQFDLPGVERTIFMLPAAGRDIVLPYLDRCAAFIH